MTQPTQELPYCKHLPIHPPFIMPMFSLGLSAEATTIANPSMGGAAIITVNIVNLPLTYFGPSVSLTTHCVHSRVLNIHQIPLGPGWVYGGPGPASIYVPTSATEYPVNTPAPTDTNTDTFTEAITPSPTSEILPTETTSTDTLSAGATTPVTDSFTLPTITPFPTTTTPLTALTTTTPTTTIISDLSTQTPRPGTLPPSGKKLFVPAGALVGIVLGAVLLVLLCGLCAFFCCCRRDRSRRSQSSSYRRRSDPRDPEVQAGWAEGSSLLAGRLAGGESPPLVSPAMSQQTLRPVGGARPRTPLSTRRLNVAYESVPAGLVGGEPRSGSPLEPSRASTEEIHRRSDPRSSMFPGRSGSNGTQHSAPLPIATSNLSAITESSPTMSTTPSRFRLAALLTPVLGGLAALGFGSRRRDPTLGEAGWEDVTPPSTSPVGLGINVPGRAEGEPRTAMEGMRTESPASDLEHGIRVVPQGAMSNDRLTAIRADSVNSGNTVYMDALSRPHTPGSWTDLPLGSTGSRDAIGNLTRPPNALVLPPVAVRRGSSPGRYSSTSNPFESQAYVQRSNSYDDALDAPPPEPLLPPGLEPTRGRWTRSVIQEEDENALDEEDNLLGGLDDEPPAPAGPLSSRHAAMGFGGRITSLQTPSPGASQTRFGSPFVEGDDDSTYGRPWSGQVQQVRLGE